MALLRPDYLAHEILESRKFSRGKIPLWVCSENLFGYRRRLSVGVVIVEFCLVGDCIIVGNCPGDFKIQVKMGNS